MPSAHKHALMVGTIWMISRAAPEEEVKEVEGIVPYTIASFVDGSVQRVTVQGSTEVKVNFTSQDFLGLGATKNVKETVRKTLEQYTVGSCGPRGFYGSTIPHLQLESELARFMGTDAAITYSDATATLSSAIPAFAKRGDVLLMDAGSNAGIQMGARLSRSKLVFWKHNDVADLKQHLEAVRAADQRTGKGNELTQRRFIVVEGLYANSGDICPLDKVVALAAEFHWRVIVDDSLGFGVLGKTGRGITEHCAGPDGKRLQVEVLVGSLSTALSSVGGFCVGSTLVVDHQVLSGAGYCFSASAPPFTCATATAALHALEDKPELTSSLRAKASALHRDLSAALEGKLVVTSDPVSPLKHLALSEKAKSAIFASIADGVLASGAKVSGPQFLKMLSPTTQAPPPRSKDATDAANRAKVSSILDDIVRYACARGVLIARSHSLEAEAFPSPPSLKLAVCASHTDADCKALVQAIKQAVAQALA